VKWSAGVVSDVPPGVVTVTSTVPGLPAGAVTLQLVVEEQLTELTTVVPNCTVIEPSTNELPVIATVVPPAAGPELGLTAVTVGPSTKVNWSAEDVADVPPMVVAVRSTAPAACAGEFTVHVVTVPHATEVPAFAPKAMVVAPGAKPTPVTVTCVPPPVVPLVGLTPVIDSVEV
jgi:hypothetical protein